MSRKLMKDRDISHFIMLCCFLYASSYITRINFSAIISEIIKVEGITKSEVSFVTTALFVSYGLGQLIFGVIGDKLSSAKLIGTGMICTSVLNFLMAIFSGNIYLMTAIWFLNGFAQAIMWPSLAKITSDYLTADGYKRACVSIAVASNVATVLVYLVAPALLCIMHYKIIFLICGILGTVMAVFWGMKIGLFEEKRVEFAQEYAQAAKGNFTSPGMGGAVMTVLFAVCTAILIQGILKDGITTWTPSFIQEVYALPSSLSILISVALPIFSIISHKMGGYIHRRFIKNEVLCAAVFFGVAVVAASVMSAVYNGNPIICVLLAGIITGCMHGVNLMLICMIPGRFEKRGNVATVSGVFNFVSYIGSSVSTYLVAKIAEIYNWQITVMLWAVLAAIGLFICLLFTRLFAKSV